MRITGPLGKGAVLDQNASFLEGIYRTYRAELCRFIERQFGPGPPEPEEIVQTAFARFAALVRPEDIRNPRAFLYTCTRNVALDLWRRHRTQNSARDAGLLMEIGDKPANLDIERVLLGQEQLAIVEATVKAMESKRRTVFIMHLIHEMGYSEIAREMSLSEARIRQLMASALEQCHRAVNMSCLD
jgi:RNA polymerase sigma factor (sigma-70 family)